MIPRSNKFNPRRCGGSFRCTNTHRYLTTERGNDSVCRSNSFRMNRGRVTADGNLAKAEEVEAEDVASYELKPKTSILKHVKYCYLQQQHHQNCSSNQQQHSALYNTNKYEDTNVKDYDCSGTTHLVPDGEDNQGRALSAPEANTDQQQHQRHSIILEPPFDLNASFDEIDVLSNNIPIDNNIPYSMLRRLLPTLKQPHQQQNLRVTQPPHAQPKKVYCMLPQSPKNAGVGVFHTKETVLQRIQQQCRLTVSNKANLAALSGSIRASTDISIGSSVAAEPLVTDDRYNVAGVKCNNHDVRNKYNNMCNNCVDRSSGGDYMCTQTLVKTTVPATTSLIKSNDSISNETVGTIRSNLNSRAQKSILSQHRSPKNFSPTNSLNHKVLIKKEDINVHTHAQFTHSNARDQIIRASTRSPVTNKPIRIPVESGVLTFKQAMSGAVSPQYSVTSVTSATLATGLTHEFTAPAIVGTGIMASRTQRSSTSKHDGHSELSVGGIIETGDNKPRQRLRTSSMPAESRKPCLADTRRAAIHCADIGLDHYRLRSFSITSHGICNLGDTLRNALHTSGKVSSEQPNKCDPGKIQIPAYKIAMLGASGVGKTTLTYQFTTSDYICSYDLSLDDEYGQKTVSVLVNDIETDLGIIDHPACEMSTEAFCSTYNVDLFVVVYSVVDRSSFKTAIKVLQYLKENEMLLTRGAILVGNKTDLERHREVNRQMGRKVAKDITCKFIETSSGLVHNVDELLVGIVAQVKLNSQRICSLSDHDQKRLNRQYTIQKHRRIHVPPHTRSMVRQFSMCQPDHGEEIDEKDMQRDENRPHNNNQHMPSFSNSEDTALSTTTTSTTTSTKGLVRKTNKHTLNLENILKMGESELEDEGDNAERLQIHTSQNMRPLSKFDLLTSSRAVGGGVRTPFDSLNCSPKSRQSYKSSSGGSGCSRGVRDFSGAASAGKRYAEENLLLDCNRKTVMKLTNRTKVFLTSVLRFRKAIKVKRSSSSSCSDLFVI